MACEWVLSGVARVEPWDLAAHIEEMASRLGLPIALSIQEDSGSAAELVGPQEWSYRIEASLEGQPALVEVNQVQVDSPGPFDGWVTAQRTRLAVLLGILTTVSWHSLAGGDVAGTGLGDEPLTDDEPMRLLTELLTASLGAKGGGRSRSCPLGLHCLPHGLRPRHAVTSMPKLGQWVSGSR